MSSNEKIYNELVKNQLKNINKNKLEPSDLSRISSNIKKSIFDNECSIWQGSILKKGNINYIAFYYKYKKISLNRILCTNFIKDLSDNQYLKCICPNKGTCCTLKHYVIGNKKLKYNNINNSNINESSNDTNTESLNDQITDVIPVINNENKSLIINKKRKHSLKIEL